MALPTSKKGDMMTGKRKENDETTAGEREETTTEGVLNAFFPGLGKMVSNLKNASPPLKQRIEENDKEMERRMASGGSKRPVIDYNLRIRTLVPENDTTTSFQPLVKKADAKIIPKQKPAGADVFDEGNEIVVVVELRGMKKEEIEVKTDGAAVEISAKDYHERIDLPCEVAGKPAVKFKNGILELRLAKKGM